MKNDKDTLMMESIYEEAFKNFHLKSNKPVTRHVNISADVRIIKTINGWKVEIFDKEQNRFIPADEFLSDMVLKGYSADISKYDKTMEDIKIRTQKV